LTQAALSHGRRSHPMDLYSSQLFPPKSPELTSAADSDLRKNFSAPVARLAAFPASYRSPTLNLPKGQGHPISDSCRGD
jgi:hypothetical protein